MALSNWDTFALNEKGEPCSGVFKSPEGVVLEIYKNWLYLKDEKVWNKSCDRPSPCIMQMYNSRLGFKDISVVSEFVGHSIYVAVWSGYEYENDNTITGMVGIGTRGFSSDKGYVGVAEKQILRLRKFLNAKTTVYAFQIPEALKNIDLNKGKRFNQGDMFFHKNLETDLQCSKPGSAEEPMILKMIKE
jgi:hypothetical protein